MTNAELLATIRAKIERRINELDKDKYINIDAKACRVSELSSLKRFLDTLSEEPDKSLEEAAKQFVGYDMDTDDLRDYEVGIQAFIAGSKWQKEQMLKDAVEGTLGYGPHLQRPIIMLEEVPTIWDGGCKPVRIVVLKAEEDQK